MQANTRALCRRWSRTGRQGAARRALRFLDVAAGSAALRRWPGELGLHRCEVAQADGMAAVAAWLDSQPGDQAWAAGCLSGRSSGISAAFQGCLARSGETAAKAEGGGPES